MRSYLFVVLTGVYFCTHLTLISCTKEVVDTAKAFTQCSEIHQISEEVINGIRNHAYIPDDQDLKCWLRCVFMKLGMIKNGKVDWSSSVHFTKLCLIGEQDQTRTDRVIKICQAQVPQDEEDECELAYSVAVCKIKIWNELGLPQGNSNK